MNTHAPMRLILTDDDVRVRSEDLDGFDASETDTGRAAIQAARLLHEQIGLPTERFRFIAAPTSDSAAYHVFRDRGDRVAYVGILTTAKDHDA